MPAGTTTNNPRPSGDDRQWAWLAHIRRPQGRKGEVFADILTDYPEKFAERRELWLLAGEAASSGSTSGSKPSAGSRASAQSTPRPVILNHHWLHKGGIVLHFAGVDSISAAEELTGLIVAIPRSERVPLAGDEAYISDLIGCTVIDAASAEPVTVGTIEDVDRTAGPVPLLVVRSARNKTGADDEILIPFANAYLRKIDLEARRVEMSLPQGLVNLNEAEEA